LYGKQRRLQAKEYADKSDNAFNEIKTITKEYNQIANGKWNGIMDMSPRKLPVFDKATIETSPVENASEAVGVIAENSTKTDEAELTLPTYYPNVLQFHFVDIFLKKDAMISWELQKLPDWVIANKKKGVLSAKENTNERLQFSIDWNKWTKVKASKTQFIIKYDNKTIALNVTVDATTATLPKKSFIAMEDRVVIYAQNFTYIKNKEPYQWKKIDGLGYAKVAMQGYPLMAESLQTDRLATEAPCLEYQIHLGNPDTFVNPEILLHAIPTLSITNKQGVRIGVQWNDEPMQVIDFRTYDRSEEWKQNVLSNRATKKAAIKSALKGANILKIYLIDAGVALDYFYINLNKNKLIPYSLLPETVKK
jgi:hypothetical protein